MEPVIPDPTDNATDRLEDTAFDGLDLDAVVDDRPDEMIAPPLADTILATFRAAATTKPRHGDAGVLRRTDTPGLIAELVRRASIRGDPRLGLAFRLIAEACDVDAAALRDAVEAVASGGDGARS